MPDSPAPVELAERTEALLSELIGAYSELSALAGEHRAALARADAGAVEACARRQAAVAQRIAGLDQQRETLVAGRRSPTLSALAEAAPEPARARLLELARVARDLIARVHREYRVVQSATQSVLAHMDGIVQQIARRLSHAGTYGRAGRVDAGGQMACGIDLRY